jgi:hypothetical protein
MRHKALIAIVVLSAFILGVAVPCFGIDLGNVLAMFGIAYAVKVYGPTINKTINKLLAQNGVEWEGTTAVVPILSVGSGTAVGAAQVAGPPELVKKVKAVAQIEARDGSFRGKGLVPVGSTDVKKGLSRVEGVGLSALVDFKL